MGSVPFQKSDHIYLQCVLPQVGDELLHINGVTVVEATHKEVIQLIAQAGQQGEVVLGVRRKMPWPTSGPVPVPPGLLDDNPHPGPREVVINRPNTQTSFGFVLQSNTLRTGCMICKYIYCVFLYSHHSHSLSPPPPLPPLLPPPPLHPLHPPHPLPPPSPLPHPPPLPPPPLPPLPPPSPPTPPYSPPSPFSSTPSPSSSSSSSSPSSCSPSPCSPSPSSSSSSHPPPKHFHFFSI